MLQDPIQPTTEQKIGREYLLTAWLRPSRQHLKPRIGRVQLDDVAKAVLECWFLYFEGSLLLGCRPSLVTASRLEAVAISLEAIVTGLLSAWRPSEVG